WRFFAKKIQITKNGGPVPLFHCAAARAARIRAFATALRLDQKYRIAGTVGAMPGLSVAHHHDEHPPCIWKSVLASCVTILRGKWGCKRKRNYSLSLCCTNSKNQYDISKVPVVLREA